MTTPAAQLVLLSDDPAATDLLSFDAVAQTVADALLDENLDPIALGLSGNWGSGKTTVLGLIETELKRRQTEDRQVVVIKTDPWRYDPTTGAKESLIAEVLSALAAEVEKSATKTDGAKNLLVRLGRRVDWAKAFKLAATSSVTLQIPTIDKLMELVKPGEADADDEVRGLDAFRDEFAALISSKDLQHIRAVVLLVDDLDRCLPETVVDSLEAIRLFLAVPRMSFVVAADEDRVADAIRVRFKTTGTPGEAGTNEAEDPAHLYLHKIVQTVIPLPALSHFDTQTFLLLLQLQGRDDSQTLDALVAECVRVRAEGGTIDDLKVPNGVSIVEELAFATRLTPLLYEKLHGNPRRIKRFLNDLAVRQSVAQRRGITLDASVVAKLMTLEVLMPAEFKELLGWLGKGQLRDQLTKLEAAAGKVEAATEEKLADSAKPKTSATKAAVVAPKNPPSEAPGDFTDAFIRWAKLTPELRERDLSPYLTLAATFGGVTLIDESLPERLRDIAANLLSDSRVEQSSVKDADLDGLAAGEAKDLLLHFGRTMRDQPGRQKAAVNATLRIVRRNSVVAATGAEALMMLPPSELSVATPLQFRADDPAEIRSVLTGWLEAVTDEHVKRSVQNALDQRVGT
jgi:hypothetical protein